MSQEIRVLHCFECDVFQVDIVKKAKKWKCRVCGVQQIVRKEHFRGSGIECRIKVQELNMQNGRQKENNLNCFLGILNNDEAASDKESKCSLYVNTNEIDSMDFYLNDSSINEFKSNELDTTNESPSNMFNFSNTQKWSKGVNSKQHSNMEDNVNSAKKRSKWDSYL